MVRPTATLAMAGLLAAFAAGCGGGPPAIALENRTFYQYDEEPTSSGRNPFERPYPPLDRAAQGGLPAYVGVSVLGGTVHLSRPVTWRIRRASLKSERRYIEYVSPDQFLFAIYERLDSPADPWLAVMGRYEQDAKAKGAELLGQRIPVATWDTQGREYVVRRTVRGQRAPYTNMSREILLRSPTRIDLVEIVHQGDTPALITSELLRVMDTLQVL